MSLAVYTFLPGWKIIRKTRFCQCQWPQEPHYITRITPERTQNLNTGLTESFLVRVRTHTSAKLASRWSSYSCTQPELRKTMRNLAAFIRLSMGGKKKINAKGRQWKGSGPKVTTYVPFSSWACVVLSSGGENRGLWEERWKKGVKMDSLEAFLMRQQGLVVIS